ncbi:hypothetical protein [Microcystis sp. M169S2]|uniref:hypothetical protein n=1 Tax=Microcystis sp. M169S2 TaxID=2771157 RepID=UPI00258CC2AF|nr:hypothetical protein [Microcystis sp. M169S2]MCA2716591.1 hypothetical protein [Microcystis sp. M169S2]
METIVIFDGNVPSNQVIKSNSFKRGQSLIFDSPGLPSDESIEFGLSIVGSFPLIGSLNQEKVLPLTFLDGKFNLLGDTSLTTYIPREISETEIDCSCYIHSTISFNLRIYVIKTEITQEKIYNTIKDFQLTESISNTAQIINEINQNAAIALLGASLAPLTLGASLAVEAPLLTGTSALTPLLLGGI